MANKKATDTKADDINALKNSRRTGGEDAIIKVGPTPKRDALDTGLEDSNWHYVWVSRHNTMGVQGYYIDGYRFVSYDDVAARLKDDELTAFLYYQTVENQVGYGDDLRLMRIPQRLYQERQAEGLGFVAKNPAHRAAEDLRNEIENAKLHDPAVAATKARISVDEDNGEPVRSNVGGS